VCLVIAAFGAALLSAVCYGLASVLQARAAQGAGGDAGSSPRMLVRVLRQTPFLVGIVLDLLGFGGQILALRGLPVFVAQAAQASNLAVTALAAWPILGMRLGRRQWTAVAAVSAGLALLGAGSGAQAAAGSGTSTRVLLLVAALALGAGGIVATRLAHPAGPIVLGVVAGLGFGLTALAVRSLPSLAPVRLLHDPAAYAVAVSGVSAFLSFATGLQRGAVTTIAALVIIGETALPAVVGIALWHDRTRPGWAVPALAGFALAVAGALALARFAEPASAGAAAGARSDR
jgi:drug/metabolite transporter (DMT)-like permease